MSFGDVMTYFSGGILEGRQILWHKNCDLSGAGTLDLQ